MPLPTPITTGPPARLPASDRMSGAALGLTLVLVFYLMATVVSYNDFLGVSASSRWPLLVLALVAGPIAFAYTLFTPQRRPAFRFSLGLLLAVFLLLEIFHTILGSRADVIGVITLSALTVLAILTRRRSKADLVGALVLVCALYLPIIYPLAYGSGMVGTGSYEKGVWVAQYLPGLGSLTLNGAFKSGRGVIGLIGGTIALYSLVRLRARTSGPLHLAGLGLGGVALLSSDSRGVILAWALVAVALLAPLPASLRARALFAMPLGVAVVQPVLLLTLIRHQQALSDLGALSRQGIADSDLSRVFAWAESVRLITASPQAAVMGYGDIGALGAMKAAFSRDYPGYQHLIASHNLLLQLLLDGGAVLMVVFLGYLLRIALFGWRHARRLRRPNLDAVAILSFLMLYGVTGSLVSLDRINEAMFIFVLTLLAVDRQMREAADAPVRAVRRPVFRPAAWAGAPRTAP